MRAQVWEAGLTLGGAGYMGDLNSRNPLQVSGGVAGVFVRKNFSEYFSAKASYNYGFIHGADANSSNEIDRNRNLSFTTYLNEVSAVAEFNFFEYRPNVFRHAFTPYVFAGLGGLYYVPTAKLDDKWYDLRSFKTENETKPYSKFAVSIPYGLGVKYSFSNKLGITADAGYRYVKTDYLDDVSGNYANPTNFTATQFKLADRRLDPNQRGSYGMQRGDSRPHDSYMFFSISISYTWISDRCYFQY